MACIVVVTDKIRADVALALDSGLRRNDGFSIIQRRLKASLGRINR
jgi:hypothetical protein